MHVVIRKLERVLSPKAAIQRAHTGQGFLMKSCPGFRGYYIFDSGDGSIGSITFFDTRDQALAAHDRAMAWVRESLADVIEGEPVVTTGEIAAMVEALERPGELFHAAFQGPGLH